MHFLGIDYGKARTGFAVGDDVTSIAFPREVVSRGALQFIEKIVAAEDIRVIVLGFPKTLDQRESDSTRAVRGFAEKLRSAFPRIPVYFQDEVFSTKAIQPGTVMKDRIDAASAALILQSFLDRKKSI